MFEVLCKEDVYYDWHIEPKPMFTKGEYYAVEDTLPPTASYINAHLTHAKNGSEASQSLHYGVRNNEGVYDWVNSVYFETIEEAISEKLGSIL